MTVETLIFRYGDRSWNALPHSSVLLGIRGIKVFSKHLAGPFLVDLVKTGKVKAPIVIGRDHLDCGSVSSPYRETEGMKDGTDAVSDWPLLNLMSNTAGGATWVSFHHGGGVGMGYSQHAGMVVLVDGTDRAERCLKRVLHNDPAMGIFRHHDAGYETASEIGEQFNLVI